MRFHIFFATATFTFTTQIYSVDLQTLHGDPMFMQWCYSVFFGGVGGARLCLQLTIKVSTSSKQFEWKHILLLLPASAPLTHVMAVSVAPLMGVFPVVPVSGFLYRRVVVVVVFRILFISSLRLLLVRHLLGDALVGQDSSFFVLVIPLVYGHGGEAGVAGSKHLRLQKAKQIKLWLVLVALVDQ